MNARVYLETSIISYLAARPSRDLVVAGHQQITHEWWQSRRTDFQLFASELVLTEAAQGDSTAARIRLDFMSGIATLETRPEALKLAQRLLHSGPLPHKAAADALHIAIAAVHGVEYLLTWNCKHIANAVLRPRVESVCRDLGYEPPVLCTPEELLEGGEYVD
jgi:predicted nucleic acid-binding protein